MCPGFQRPNAASVLMWKGMFALVRAANMELGRVMEEQNGSIFGQEEDGTIGIGLGNGT